MVLIFLCLCIAVLRTLTGHKASVRSLDFHPLGDYVASGSQDSTIKVSLKLHST